MKKYLYVVPRKKFFSEGYRGRVMHALGVAEGLVLNGNSVDFIGGDGLSSFKDDLPAGVNLIEIKETKKGFFGFLAWNVKLFKKVREVSKLNDYESLIVRYAISIYILLYLFTFFDKKTKKIIEINTLACHNFFINNKYINKLISKLEIFLLSKYDVFYAVSQSMATDLINKNFKGNSVVIPNGSTSKKINFTNSKNNYINKTRLVYLGSIMHYWDYMPLIEAYKNSNYMYELHFIGSGPMEDYIREQVGKNKVVKFHGQFNRNNLGAILSPNTDILYLPPVALDEMTRTGGLSTKAFDYLSMKLPIIAPSDGELTNVYSHKKNAMLYNRNNYKEINSLISELINDVKLREEISINAYNDFVKNHSWKSRMKILIDKIELIKGKK